MLQVWRHSVRNCVKNLFKIISTFIKWIKINKIIWLSFELCTWKIDFDVRKVDIFSVSHWFFQKKLKLWDFFLKKFESYSLLTTYYPHSMEIGECVKIIFVCVYLKNIFPKISVKSTIFWFSFIFFKKRHVTPNFENRFFVNPKELAGIIMIVMILML